METLVTAPLFLPCTGDGLRLGLGGAPLGNLFAAVTDAKARATVEAAWASGYRSFDTANTIALRVKVKEERLNIRAWTEKPW